MAEPKQKSFDLPLYISRNITPLLAPQWLEAERWRQVVQNQPIAIACRDSIINDLKATGFEIRARNPKEEDKYSDDIEYYRDIVLNVDCGDAIQGFDPFIDKVAQDLLSVPFGGICEVVRYDSGMEQPLPNPHPKGHVHKLAYIDPATTFVTYDEQFPIAQRLQHAIGSMVLFTRNEVSRFVMSPRTEIQRRGYGMAPPEKIYLAIEMLYRGDSYYANLLLDTPEAGVLDLVDMEKSTAREWLQGFRELFAGIDPFKIPVLYEHTTPAKFIPFGQPPSEMLYDSTTLKYAQVVHAGYGLTLTDTGLGDPQKTLAGSIRDERRSRRSGYAAAKEIIRNAINNDVLPPYLEFDWVESDEEAKTQKGRSFLLAVQAMKWARQIGVMTARESQQQLVKDGYITVEVGEPDPMLLLPGIEFGAINGQSKPPSEQTQQEVNRVPAAEGGRGDITGQAVQKAELGDGTVRDNPHYDQMKRIFDSELSGIQSRATRPRLMRLIKAATRLMFPDVGKAFVALSSAELVLWREERLKLWFGHPSAFDDFPQVKKASQETLDEIENSLESDSWWTFGAGAIAAILAAIKGAFSDGATVAARIVQEFLYTEGLRDNPDLPDDFEFNLVNPATLKELNDYAADLVRRVDDGTKFYMKRLIVSGVDEGLSSPKIAQMIRDGASVDEVLRSADFVDEVIGTVKAELESLSEYRANSIVNTEINRAESRGRLGQWKAMGLTKKAWAHTGADTPCRVCTGNIDLGMVDIDYEFEDVFGGTQTPPGHPGVCHCHLEFDEAELIGKAGDMEVWDGE